MQHSSEKSRNLKDKLPPTLLLPYFPCADLAHLTKQLPLPACMCMTKKRSYIWHIRSPMTEKISSIAKILEKLLGKAHHSTTAMTPFLVS